MEEKRDRTVFIPPPHKGPNVLPNNPFFNQVLRHAHRNRLAIRDDNHGLEKTYADLLVDALTLGTKLVQALPKGTAKRLEAGDEVYIGILAPGGYEYVVGVVAALAIGAAVVPMTVALPVDEAVYYVEKSRQAAILVSSNAMELGRAIVAKINHSQDEAIECIAIAPNIVQSAVSLKEIVVSSGSYTDDNSAGCLIFTSGTSGSPKPAVLPRGYIHEAARGVADHFDLRPGDVILHVLPVHHVTGLVINILPFIMAGACIEFRSGSFDPQWIWDRWRKGGLTFFSGVPTIFLRMMRYHQQVISKLPTAERTAYEEAADQFRAIICGTSALPRPVQDFWTRIRKGKPILTRYGSTEAGAVLMVPLEGESVPDGSVGRVVPGVDLKLSEGEEGEILIKSPHLFSRYLFDEAATANAFDERGYFKTGDIARREGENYFISGRASQDIIKSGGYKISALDIEREVLALPYISEVMVVGVEDEEFGQRVAALVTLLDGTRPEQSLSINGFRGDLRSKLAGYKLPTLLRIVKGDLPKTASGKVLKKKLGLKFFPCPGWEQEPQIQVWRSGSSKL